MLQLALFASSTGAMIADLSSRVTGLKFTTNEHGFQSLSCTVAATMEEAFRWYDRPGLPHIEVNDGAARVWEGRLEDVAISDAGAQLTALGYWRALSDVPYTAFWSQTGVAGWKAATQDLSTGYSPQLFEMDNNNRLYIAPRKGETYGATGTAKAGGLAYYAPDDSQTELQTAAFTYDLTAITNWNAALLCYDAAGAYLGMPWTLAGNNAQQTSAVTVTLTAGTYIVVFALLYAAADAAYAGETGDDYLKITGVRLKGTDTATVQTSEIAAALAVYVNGINPSQLADATTLLDAPGLDLQDEIYEDEYPADILTRLVKLGDSQTPPRQWEVGVMENQCLHLRLRGAVGYTWYVDAASLEVQRSLETLRNSIYGVYKDAGGRTLRTPIAVDAGSVARYGITRRSAIGAPTTSATSAGVQRDAALYDRALPPPRSAITFRHVYDSAGGMWPLWTVRSGDIIVVRNLPPALTTDVDRIRTFRIATTDYDAETDTLSIVPEQPLPSLEVLQAQTAGSALRVTTGLLTSSFDGGTP